jgi:hypothetical protein
MALLPEYQCEDNGCHGFCEYEVVTLTSWLMKGAHIFVSKKSPPYASAWSLRSPWPRRGADVNGKYVDSAFGK